MVAKPAIMWAGSQSSGTVYTLLASLGGICEDGIHRLQNMS